MSRELLSALAEPFEAVRQCRAILPLVRKLRDEEREWLGVAGDS
jgi:hypothetical protein